MSKFVVLISLLFTTQAFASGSFGVRGGGNTCVEQFISYGKMLYANAKNIDYDAKAFIDKVRTAEIVEVDTEMVLFEGNQYTAMNEPSANRIYLSQKWCREAVDGLQASKTAMIVFHEVLGLSEPGRDKNFEVSSDLYDKTGLTEEDFHYLVLTNGRDRHLFETDVYTWARSAMPAYPMRSYLKLAADNMNASAVFDCRQSVVKYNDGSETEFQAMLIIMGHPSKYTFFNAMMCENLLEFLRFRNYSNVKVSFLVGTTTATIYKVILQ